MLKPGLKHHKRVLLRLLLSAIMLYGFVYIAVAQKSPKATISNIITAVNNRNTDRAVEKLYLQTDKPIYHTGDTLWFKAYLLEQTYLRPSKKSGVLYVELANDSNRMIKRIMLPINGITYGNIALDNKLLPQGGYTLRAYTNWIRNFDEALIFKKSLYISGANNNDWLINYNTRYAKDADKYNVQLALNVNSFDTGPVGLREMQLRLTDGKRTWFKNNINTDIGGLANVNFDLPEKADFKNLYLSIRDLRKGEGNRALIMPLAFNRPENIDLQFMPEGGSLVAGLPANIAFKAINEDGHGAVVSGGVFNSKQQQVAVFSTAHYGIGAFSLLPQAGEVYTAKLKLPDGSYKSYPLPVVKPSGFTLKVSNPFKSDSIEVTVGATPEAANGNSYYLMGHAREMAFYGALVSLKNGIAKIHINKKIFPGGVVSFALIGADKRALNQRMIFADGNDKLNISISSSKPVYKQRDSVALNIKVADMDGAPVQGSFSLAVTDDGQVKTDSLKSTSIVTYLLLASNLKGSIEAPGYYEHCTDDATKWQHLDQLLLAQGWAVYDWDAAFAPQKTLPFAAEPEFLVTGRVTNAFNKPVANSGVLLFSRKPMLMIDTVTNATGTFTFKGVFPADTAVYFLQARNKKGKSSNVGIEMDEFKPPVFAPLNDRITPWYVNADNNNLSIIKKQLTLQQNLETFTRGKMLKEVVIKNKRIIKDSKNLNGPGEADVIIDEGDLQKAGRTTLGDLLSKRVKGFGYRPEKKTGILYYNIYGATVHLIVDGVNTEFFMPEGETLYQYLKQYFDYYDAEEIKGIEVMANPSHSGTYTSRYLPPLTTPWEHTFIEVTTRGGHGPFVKKAIGTYVYRPMPFTTPKQFYAPKYTISTVPDMTDIRSTIHWEPDFVTDKDGKATISFFTADAPGKYTIIAEGADLQGSVGVKRASISVEKR